MSAQLMYPFTFGDRTQSDLLGGKGANIIFKDADAEAVEAPVAE